MTYQAEVLADSPIAYWRLGEPSGTTMSDSVGTNHGLYNNTPTLGAASLISNEATNTAVRFTAASSEYGEVDDNPTISAATGTTACSWEFWVKLASDVNGTWIGKFNNLQISRSATTGIWKVDDYGVVQACHSSTGFTDTTTAHHIVATKDGSGNWKFYIDGVDRTVTDNVAQLTDNGSSIAFALGSELGFADGTMDEIAAYGSVLSAARVLAHYNAAFETPDVGGAGEASSFLPLRSLRSLRGLR